MATNDTALTLAKRPRRLRRSQAVRDLIRETRVELTDFIQPIFVKDGSGEPESVTSMPGVFRYSKANVVEECDALSDLGIRAIALFPVLRPELKDPTGSVATTESNHLFSVIRAIKRSRPDLIVITDVALDPYTDHGHDGLLNPEGTDVDNDPTVSRLCELAIAQAEAGADWVAPSDMMDGRVGAIRNALDGRGFSQVAILAYAAKFASAYYGPFRDAVGSQQAAGNRYLSKKSYQLDPANAREGLHDALLDEAEGADMLMVKPGGPYLDILWRLRERCDLPLAAYQVSGEYAQVHAAAKMGWLDYWATRDESLLALKRAGADLILTYFAKEIARERAGLTNAPSAS